MSEKAVLALRVLLVDGESHCFAQALEIDYCGEGTSREDVQERFLWGLRETIKANVQFGSARNLLKPLPRDEYADLLMNTVGKEYVLIIAPLDPTPGFPFAEVHFLAPVEHSPPAPNAA